jgi:hypothetical protein
VLRAAEETETTEENIQDWLQLDEGDPGFQLLTQEEIAAVKFFIYFHQHYLSIYPSISGSTVHLFELGCFFSFLILYTVGTTPWTGDQPVARPLSTHIRT